MEDFWLIVTLKEWTMKPKPGRPGTPLERLVRGIRRVTRKQYSAEEKIRIVLDGLRGEQSIAELCRRENIAESLYYSWSKEFLEAGKRRLAGDTARAATTSEVSELRHCRRHFIDGTAVIRPADRKPWKTDRRDRNRSGTA